LEDWKIKISVLWLIYAAVGLGSGFFMLWEPGVIEDIIAGKVMGIDITPVILLIDIIFLLIPLAMAFLSLSLKDSINRWANIIVGVFSIGLMLTGFAESTALYAILVNLSMIAAAVLIVWYAWKSKPKA
jgi:hypothetical protein